MRIHFREFDFEGTSEEFRDSGLMEAVQKSGKDGATTGVAYKDGGKSNGELTLRDQLAEDEEFLRQVLGQRPISPLVDKVLRVLLGAEPIRKVPHSELETTLECTEDQIDGALGSLGRRINATPRADMTKQIGLGVVLEFARAGGVGEWCYTLRPSFRRLLEAFYASR
jgi:hypothetical protein